MAVTTDSLIDKDFGIGVNAISVKRTAEYYQWHETKSMVYDSHRYRLAVLSSRFGHYVVSHCWFPHMAICLRW